MSTNVIWKFPLPMLQCAAVSMPAGAQILTVQEQFNEPVMWAIVDPAAPTVTRSFEVACTGNELPVLARGVRKYVATFQTDGGNYVFHVFELTSGK